jgi:hypothetical protein
MSGYLHYQALQAFDRLFCVIPDRARVSSWWVSYGEDTGGGYGFVLDINSEEGVDVCRAHFEPEVAGVPVYYQAPSRPQLLHPPEGEATSKTGEILSHLDESLNQKNLSRCSLDDLCAIAQKLLQAISDRTKGKDNREALQRIITRLSGTGPSWAVLCPDTSKPTQLREKLTNWVLTDPNRIRTIASVMLELQRRTHGQESVRFGRAYDVLSFEQEESQPPVDDAAESTSKIGGGVMCPHCLCFPIQNYDKENALCPNCEKGLDFTSESALGIYEKLVKDYPGRTIRVQTVHGRAGKGFLLQASSAEEVGAFLKYFPASVAGIPIYIRYQKQLRSLADCGKEHRED